MVKLGRFRLFIEHGKFTIRHTVSLEEAIQFHLLCESEVRTIYDVKSAEYDYKFFGSIQEASALGYYTAPYCKTLGKPVTNEELMFATNFAQLTKCKRKFYLGGAKPCVSVFYRGTDIKNKFIEGLREYL